MRVHLDATIGFQRALRFLERGRVFQPERHRLEDLPAKDWHELLILAPDLRLERRAARAERADYVPVAPREPQLFSNVCSSEAADDLFADADLRPPRLRPPAIGELHVGAHVPHALAHTAGDDVGQRQHADEHRDDEADAKRRERSGRGALEHTPRVVHDRDLHSTCLSAWTTGNRAARSAGTSPLATMRSNATTAPNANVFGVTSKPGR